MCGILGYFGSISIRLYTFLDILGDLEASQFHDEKSPVGGHGAGIVTFIKSFEIEKVGKNNGSPVAALKQMVSDHELTRIIGHVRHASPAFEDTIAAAECTQPYLVGCLPHYEIVSVHNGFFKSYEKVKSEIDKEHEFESANKRLVDSDVIPHYLEFLLMKEKSVSSAVDLLYERLDGNGNAVAFWVKLAKGHYLALLYKGRARGLYVWINKQDGLLFSSRKEPIDGNIGEFLMDNHFSLVNEIGNQEDAAYKHIFEFH